jgi:hypothetical protein
MELPENDAPAKRCRERLKLYAETGNAIHAWGALQAWLELRDEYPELPFPMPKALAKYLYESAINVICLTDGLRPQAYQNGHPIEGSRTKEHLQPGEKLKLLPEALQLRGGRSDEWNAYKAYKQAWDPIYFSNYEKTLKELGGSGEQRCELMNKITHSGTDRGHRYRKKGGRAKNPTSPFLAAKPDTGGDS